MTDAPSPALTRKAKGPANPLSSTLSGDGWRKWKDFVFPIEGNLTARKSKERLEAKRAGKRRADAAPGPLKITRTPHPPLERLVFAGLRAADDPSAPEDTVAEIAAEVQKQLDVAEQSRGISIKRVEGLQQAKDALREELAAVAARHAAVRQAYLQKRTARFEDQSRKSDESIGVDSDVDYTIELLREEIDAVRDEVQYLEDAFGSLGEDPAAPPVEEEEEEPGAPGDDFE
jgi:hypothetical protein